MTLITRPLMRVSNINKDISHVEEEVDGTMCKVPVSGDYQWNPPHLYKFVLYFMNKIACHVKEKKERNQEKLKVNSCFFDGLGKTPRLIKQGATTWRALEPIYSGPTKLELTPWGLVDWFWTGKYGYFLNVGDVRNRYILVKELAKKHILLQYKMLKEHSGEEKVEVRICSLASGSCRAIIEVMGELKRDIPDLNVKLLLIDQDEDALKYAQKIAVENGVHNLQSLQANVLRSKCLNSMQEFKAHMFDAVGIFDYLPKKLGTRFVRNILEALQPQGVMMLCNIRPNPEEFFMEQVVDWGGMIYRTVPELLTIVTEAGFSRNNSEVWCEPRRKTHAIVLAQKK